MLTKSDIHVFINTLIRQKQLKGEKSWVFFSMYSIRFVNRLGGEVINVLEVDRGFELLVQQTKHYAIRLVVSLLISQHEE